MKGPSMLNVGLSFLIVAIIAIQITALSPEETCPLVKNMSYIADPTSCQGWVYCVNNTAFYGKCDEGLLYDSSTGTCGYPDDVSCNIDRNSMCNGLTGVYKADPSNCDNYCYCEQGQTYCARCPGGMVFNPLKTMCDYKENYPCQANSQCFLAPNGFMLQGTGCNKWARCSGGQAVALGDCPQGYLFNRNNGKCDYPNNVDCNTSPTPGPDPGTPTVPPSPPNLCTGRNGNTFYPDKATCRGYFFCKPEATGPGQWGQCPKGSHFDPTSKNCVDPEKVPCTFDRCDGITAPFMAVANTKCNEYYNCKKGVADGKGKCPPEYPYYNEVAGACQSVAVTLPICTETGAVTP